MPEFNQVFKITNKYIVLATPLILYSLLSTLYMVASAGSGKRLVILFSVILFVLMTSAFFAGWFKMIVGAVKNVYDENPNSLMKEFTEGVGEYFLTTTLSFLVILIFSSILLILAGFIGLKTIGSPDISGKALIYAMHDTTMLKSFLMSLSQEQLAKLGLWNILFIITTSINYFLLMLYYPVIFFKNKNTFLAFFIALKELFSKKFFTSFLLFILLLVSYLILSLFSAVATVNLILHFLLTLVSFYYMVYVATCIFYYYYKNFVAEDNNLGQNIDVKI